MPQKIIKENTKSEFSHLFELLNKMPEKSHESLLGSRSHVKNFNILDKDANLSEIKLIWYKKNGSSAISGFKEIESKDEITSPLSLI